MTEQYRQFQGGDTVAEVVSGAASQAERLGRWWAAEFEAAESAFADWRTAGTKVIRHYRDEKDSRVRKRPRKYNAYHSITQTTKSHLLMDPPQPMAQRSHLDSDGAGRDGALLIERALVQEAREDSFYDALWSAVDDYQHTARGVTWVVYAGEFGKQQARDPSGQPVFGADGQPQVEPVKIRDRIRLAHIPWQQFWHEPAARWEDVGWVAREASMTRTALVKKFGEIGRLVPLKSRRPMAHGADKPSDTDDSKRVLSRARVLEIWDKRSAKIVWFAPDYPDSILGYDDDPPKFPGFFPCPRPIYGTITTDSLIPRPDYSLLQDLFDELDDVTDRIRVLTRALRVTGGYDSENPGLKNILEPNQDNKLYPVDNWGVFAEAGGLKAAIDYMPLEPIRQVLESLYKQRNVCRQELFEITGLADVVRGASDYRETAKAQEIKGDFATMSLRAKQRAVARHAREALNLMGALIIDLFDAESIQRASAAEQMFIRERSIPNPMDPEAPPQVVKEFDFERFSAALRALKGDPERLRIVIDTESLGGLRREQELAEATGFLKAVGDYISTAIPAVKETPGIGPLLLKGLMFGVRRFRIGRTMEAEIEEEAQKLLQAPPQPQGAENDNGPSPAELEIEKMKLQLEMRRLEIEAQKAQAALMRATTEAQERMGRLQVDAQSRARDAESREKRQTLDAMARFEQIEAQREQTAEQATTQRRGQDMQAAVALDKAERAERTNALGAFAEQIAAGEAAREADYSRRFKAAQQLAEQEHDSEERDRDRTAQRGSAEAA